MLPFKSYAALLALAVLSNMASGDICLMLYQMADNNLEYFIREDNYELSISPVIRNPTMTTWVYFDHRNFKGSNEDIDEPLRNVFQSDGSVITGTKTTLSEYLRWDHSIGKLVLDRTLPIEQNGDDPTTITNFLVTAMQDCVAKGSTEFFVVFASHGGGFDGFGSDENTRRWRRRSLTQSNKDIESGLRSALNQVTGAPEKFDVIGFDACLMQAFGAADDYRSVGKYLLASEAVEPGHGWAYNLLSKGETALDLARDIQSSFLESTHGLSTHMTPKTLAIVDLAKYDIFLNSWDALSAELRRLLTRKDPEVYTQMNRARNAAIAFESVVDDVGTNGPSAADIGSFMHIFANGCVPSPGSSLESLLSNAQNAYVAMFLERGVGEGTPEATGMHVIWPVRREFAAYQTFYQERLFDTTLPYATAAAPEWLELLKTFYSTTTPPSSSTSVCTKGVETAIEPEPGQLLIGPKLSGIQNGGHLLTMEIARQVDDVFVEFGVDFSSEFVGGRKLLSSTLVDNAKTRRNTTNQSSIVAGTMVNRRIISHPRSELCEDRRERRRLQQSQKEYLFIFGGNLIGTYDQASFTALWDRRFFLFRDSRTTDQFLNFYTFDNGGSQKSTPVIYMPPDNPITSETIRQAPLGIGELDFIRAYGGQFGSLSFNSERSDGTINDGITLFTNDGSSLSETPRSAGGQIVPVQLVEGFIDGVEVSVIVGGISATVLDWDDNFSIRIATADFYLNQLGLERLVLDVLAADDDALLQNDLANGIDFVTFNIAKDGSIKLETYNGGVNSSSKRNPSLEGWHFAALLLVAIVLSVI